MDTSLEAITIVWVCNDGGWVQTEVDMCQGEELTGLADELNMGQHKGNTQGQDLLTKATGWIVASLDEMGSLEEEQVSGRGRN